MANYTLYCFAQSGNAYKAALMLNLCQADWQPRFVDFFNGETRTPEYREKINELGEVPVLEHHLDGNSERLSQTGVILDYLSDGDVLGRFGGRSAAEQREIRRWILFDNHKFTSYIATLRFLLQFTDQGETPVTEFFRGRMLGTLKIVDKRLEQSAFIASDRVTIADFSLCGYLFFNDEFGVDWGDYPNIDRWLGDIKSLPDWVHPYQLMPGHPLPGK